MRRRRHLKIEQRRKSDTRTHARDEVLVVRDTLIHLAAGDAFERAETTLPCELISVARK